MANDCTRIDLNVGVPLLPKSQLEEAYQRVRQQLSEQTMTATSGYSLWWTDGGALHQTFINENPNGAIVVGRHTQCDVPLPNDTRIGLRHFLARCQRDENRVLEVEFISLRSHLPYTLPNGEPYESFRACGCVCVSLGHYAIIAIPNGANSMALPDTVPDPMLRTLHPAPAEAVESVSRVAPRPNAAVLAELPPSAAEMAGRLCIRAGDQEHVVWINDDHLRDGVIVGRYARCVGGPVRKVLSDSVSRAHALLIRDGERVIAYDLSSRNGIWQGRKRQRAIPLSKDRNRFYLGRRRSVEVIWHRGLAH